MLLVSQKIVIFNIENKVLLKILTPPCYMPFSINKSTPTQRPPVMIMSTVKLELDNELKCSFQSACFNFLCLVGIVELIAATIAHTKKNVALKMFVSSYYRLLRSLKHDINQKKLQKISQISFDHCDQTGQ